LLADEGIGLRRLVRTTGRALHLERHLAVLRLDLKFETLPTTAFHRDFHRIILLVYSAAG
jgi:hypothetical protein